MKPIKPILMLLIAVITFQFSYSQTDQDAMMKAWTAYMTPGDVHKTIAKADGEWTTDISMWMDPNGKPITSQGVCVNKMILGGRYQQSSYKGDMMGMKMEGIGTLGYDNAKKVFESSWVDNMGTGLMYLSGPWDDATKTITLKGKSIDPTTGKDLGVRETYQFVDDKHHVMQMFMTPDGATEFKSMEIKFTKK